jgi:hypothetical protein
MSMTAAEMAAGLRAIVATDDLSAEIEAGRRAIASQTADAYPTLLRLQRQRRRPPALPSRCATCGGGYRPDPRDDRRCAYCGDFR